MSGSCSRGTCATGWYDLDGDPGNGCEASCAGATCTVGSGSTARTVTLSAPPMPETGPVASAFASSGPIIADAGDPPPVDLTGILGEPTPLPYHDGDPANPTSAYVENDNSLVGAPVGVAGAPHVSAGTGVNLFLADVNGDGLADMVLVDTGHVEVWPLLPSGSYGPKIAIANTPYRDPSTTAVRLADMDANGSVDIVWSTPSAAPEERFVYLDLVGDLRPNLLVAVEDGLGHRHVTGHRYREPSPVRITR